MPIQDINGRLSGGNRGNKGGMKGRSGRCSKAITEAAQKIFNKYKLLEVAAKIATGELDETRISKTGEVFTHSTSNADRLAAIKFLASYGFGQPLQMLEARIEEVPPHEIILVPKVRRGS